MERVNNIAYTDSSLSARRAWIEICNLTQKKHPLTVALRKESVDRNLHNRRVNLFRFEVALRKESVDRNNRPNSQKDINRRSLSARRAWIEIPDVSSKIWYCGSRSPQGERG